jgi:hypothetical protein
MKQKGSNNIVYFFDVSFKIFTKNCNYSANSVANHVVRPSQIAFMQGRNIHDGVVTLHEIYGARAP